MFNVVWIRSMSKYPHIYSTTNGSGLPHSLTIIKKLFQWAFSTDLITMESLHV